MFDAIQTNLYYLSKFIIHMSPFSVERYAHGNENYKLIYTRTNIISVREKKKKNKNKT